MDDAKFVLGSKYDLRTKLILLIVANVLIFLGSFENYLCKRLLLFFKISLYIVSIIGFSLLLFICATLSAL